MRQPRSRPARWAWIPDRLTVLSAFLIVLAFPPWNLAPLIWVALVPWFAAVRTRHSAKRAFLEGIWLSVFMSLGGFYWVAFVLREFGGVPWPISVFGLVLFSFVGQPQFPIFAWILKRFEKTFEAETTGKRICVALALALAYSGLDWVLPKLFMDTLGHSFYASPHLSQAADLGGAWLLTFVVFLANWALWELHRRNGGRYRDTRKALRRAAPELGTAALFCLATWTYGLVRLGQISRILENSKHQEGGSAVAALVQANIGDFDKVAAERGVRGAAAHVLDTFFDMSREAMKNDPKPDFVVWPETSYPSVFGKPQTEDELARDARMESFVHELGVPLLFGGYDHEGYKDFNSFFFLTPPPRKARLANAAAAPSVPHMQVYHKSILLMFGEYIPFAEHIRFMRELFPEVGYFGRGPGPEAIRIPVGDHTVRAAPVICYEVLFPRYAIEAARKGGQFLLNITNDSWFGPYGEPQLHLALSTFRSIETRLPQLRSTNTGISALILPDGEIRHPSGVDDAEILKLRVPITPAIPTLMKAWGDWFGLFSLFLGFGSLVFLIRSARQLSKD